MPGSRATQLYRTKRLSGRSAAGRLVAVLFGVVTLLFATPGWAASPQSDALAKARLFYNERQYDQAIQIAEKALSAPALADSARVVIARSYLERFRQSSNDSDLQAARDVLRQVQATTLTARDRADLLIGLGESLYLDNAFGAASEIFSSAFGTAAPRDVRESVLDWWASSLERVALQGPAEDREDIYLRIVERMEEELISDPSSVPAAYWLAAASRGAGDFERAWNAAMSGWVRALLSPAHGTTLRGDLDHLMETAIIPERATKEAERQAPAERPAVERVTAELKKEWEGFKAAWK